MRSADIRTKFLDFFNKQGHEIVASSSLVPHNDNTLLFTNAGMVQFKDVFLGSDQRDYVRAVSSQRCVRAGGKHNDLENVGYTARHHTFFEMLGNFSFGDYFKSEAIHFAWDFLTKELGIPKAKLWVTVFQDDDEAAAIWENEIGVDPARITRCGEKDNFWSMGDTGPCGPCSEIFYDHGEEIPGGPPGSEGADLDRYIEIWNMVFMQYQRFADGSMTPLPKPSVDTGMGLERISAVMQDVHDNYDIDLFQHLIKAIIKITHTKDTADKSLRVIADHIRSTSFLISDGVIPSNEGRGYVLRRIVRRAIRHGSKLGLTKPFFHQLVAPLAAEMGEAYPELRKQQHHIEQVLLKEEQQFAATLENGLKMLEQAIAGLSDKTIPGEVIFKLYDTYGFPVDLTGDIAREQDLQLDMPGFEAAMKKQRTLSQQGSQFAVDYTKQIKVEQQTQFSGYELLADQALVVGLFKGNQPVETLNADDDGFVVLDRTPFYAESGGQMGDKGLLCKGAAQFQVHDTTKAGQAHVHHGRLLQGELSVGDVISCEVDSDNRRAIALNHSATHLLHAALRNILGEHVQQKGSLVEAPRLRFDFAHFSPITPAELHKIETLVNEKIRENLLVETKLMRFEDAKRSGAIALFGEKYSDEVRVLAMGDFSIELCGGTHVRRTGDIGLFKIISETGVAAGVRRLEAVTGQAALAWVSEQQQQLDTIAQQVKSKVEHTAEKVAQELQAYRQLKKDYDRIKAQLDAQASQGLAQRTEQVHGVTVLIAELTDVDAKSLRTRIDELKQQLASGIILLAATQADKVNLIAGVTDDLTHKIRAGDLIAVAAEHVGGKGGGRADLAQAGGTQPENIAQAFAAARAWLERTLN